MEFMNSFYTFSTARGNTTFTVTVGSTTHSLSIRDGNYTTTSMVIELNKAFAGLNITASYDSETNQFIFTSSATGGEIITFPTSITNPYGNGLGFNLGFQNMSITISTSSPYQIASNSVPNLIQDTYVYLQINDWNLVEHQQYGQTSYPVFAKIQLTGAKNTIIFDSNYLNSSTKEYVFHQPVNIQRLEIRMLDAYGTTLDLRGGVFSMTLELHQVNSSAVYEDLIKTL